jgi:RNA polymerase sigma-70 factor (ECF subfamily)
MAKSLLRTDREIAEIYGRHVKTVYRVCFAYMKTPADTEDAVQDAFVKLITSEKAFESEEHEKAWLIRTAANLCKDKLRSASRKSDSLDDYEYTLSVPETEIDDTLRLVRELPDRYKAVIYLYYYEGYTSVEIAEILRKPRSTIRNYLSEARELLRGKLGADYEKQ